MRVLLDHCVPRPFERRLIDCETIHTSRLGWGGLKNGKLLAAAAADGFAVMVTVDRSMRFQQNMDGRNLSVTVLHVPANDIQTVADMADAVRRQLGFVKPGTVVTLVHPDMV